MARKDALLRLHARLVTRRDALRKALKGDLDGYREFAALNVVGDFGAFLLVLPLGFTLVAQHLRQHLLFATVHSL